MAIDSREQLREKVAKFIAENPIKEGERGCYDECATRFGLTAEQVRRIYRTLKERSEKAAEGSVAETATPKAAADRTFSENVKSGEANVTVVTAKRIKTLADLVKVCEIDLNEWEILSWEANKWEVGRKEKKVSWSVEKGVAGGDIQDSGRIFVEPLFQVKAKLSKRKLQKDIGLQKEALLAELKAYTPNYDLGLFKKLSQNLPKSEKKRLLEISIFDHHFGKLAWRAETDEDYDVKIAEKRFRDAVTDLLSEINVSQVDRILFPLGNDLINIDNANNTTTAGTAVHTDVRYPKIFKVVRRVLIDVITNLAVIAPVDVIMVPGNHDTLSVFTMGEVLDAHFHAHPDVTIDNRPIPRKYYQYGQNGFQFTHGNEEKHADLGMLFATEQPALWASTKFRFAQLGHFHKNKKINYISIEDHIGYQVQILPSLSGTDAWHFKKGYRSMHMAKAFLYDKDEGPRGELSSTL